MRKFLAFLMALSGLISSVRAQSAAAVEIPPPSNIPIDQLIQMQEFIVPKNEASFGIRLLGRLNVTFSNLGTISGNFDPGDLSTEMTRAYNDGSVSLDTRVDADGNNLLDDGRTNTWSYRHHAQVTDDESGINFHAYNSTADSSLVTAKAGPSMGFDFAGSHEFGRYGAVVGEGRRKLTVGALFGFGLNTLNASSRGKITANLHTVTDTYSLLGFPVPESDDSVDDNGYSAPSSTTQTVINADGTTSQQVLDNTTYLANLPDARTESTTPSGAEIDGFWQVRGAYFSVRTGPWVRWQPLESLSLKLSGGGALAVIGMTMRYDEHLMLPEPLDSVQATDTSEAKSYTAGGFFGSFDAEWWMTGRTGFFGSAYYEKFSHDADIALNGRIAQLETSGGLGLRVGITTKF